MLLLMLLLMMMRLVDLDAEKCRSFECCKLISKTHSSSGVELEGRSSLRKAWGGRMLESKL